MGVVVSPNITCSKEHYLLKHNLWGLSFPMRKEFILIDNTIFIESKKKIKCYIQLKERSQQFINKTVINIITTLAVFIQGFYHFFRVEALKESSVTHHASNFRNSKVKIANSLKGSMQCHDESSSLNVFLLG